MIEQLELIKQDINFIEKYYGTDNFNGLINDMLFHLNNAKINYEKRIENITNYLEEIYKENLISPKIHNQLYEKVRGE